MFYIWTLAVNTKLYTFVKLIKLSAEKSVNFAQANYTSINKVKIQSKYLY